MALTASQLLKVAAELKIQPSVLLDVICRVVEESTGVDVERLSDLKYGGNRSVALTL